ncbi:hypothetical protein [Paenibacillus ginsengarvi]|uniref:Uncharacterized protein n=1 Tax=Paenibacillus ginsengarvi TaxID=400777 RepID=A0A3B0C077_9BACL|nr:hypothetical protein [Paenibacillus ginsengarvi]RKN77076.1 hypothetical protein D7M11_23925 [Paenibacillus ginsengarvi]
MSIRLDETIPCQQITKLVAPFGYRRSLEECQEVLPDNLWQFSDPMNQRLLRHIDNLVKKPSHGAQPIGRRWLLSEAGRLAFGIPSASESELLLQMDQQRYVFYIHSVELYLFETNVGFVVFNIQFPAKYTLDQMIQANFHLKKFTLPQLQITYDEQGNRRSVNLGASVRSMVEPFDWETFFEQDELLIALVYSMALLPQVETDQNEFDIWLGRKLFHMRRSFADSFKPTHEQCMLLGQEVEPVFQNSYWGASMEGMANVAYLTGDSSTDHFFKETYINNVNTTYFYLYILALHQRFALLMLSILASRLPAQLERVMLTNETNEILDNKGYELISELQERMTFFTLRSSFTQVSNVTHQARLYEKLRHTLRIEDLMQELHTELEVLSSLAHVREQKREERQRMKEQHNEAIVEKRQNRFQSYVMLMTTLFVVISTFADSLNVVGMVQNRTFPPLYSGPFYLLLSFGLLIAGAVAMMFWVMISNWHFKKRYTKHQ